MPDFDADRWNKIVSNGVFAQSVAISLDGTLFSVNGIVGKGFSRKETDGRLTTEEPLGTISVQIYESALPSEISRGLYTSLLFKIDGVSYAVENFTGYEIIRFFLKATESVVDDSDDDEVVVENPTPVDVPDEEMEW
jgi:hypothetical protein